jgi:hypothetical protein
MADPHHATDAADADAHAYIRGEMEINEHVSTWNLVQNLFKWGSLGLATLILFLVMWFQPNGSFFPALISGVVVFVAGFFFLRSGKGH